MVVSGLPIRNGQGHAGEIADFALHLLSSLKTYQVPDFPEYKVQLRIGLHSGKFREELDAYRAQFLPYSTSEFLYP